MKIDEMIREAAAESVESYMKSIMNGYDSENAFTPSPQFERKISKLTCRANHPYIFRARKWAASMLLTFFLTGAVWLAVDLEARAAFMAWIRETYAENVTYNFFGQRDPEPLPEYAFALLPEGFVETDVYNLKSMCTRVYKNNEEEILFFYMHMSEQSTMGIFSEDYHYETVQVGSCTGDFFEGKKPDETNELIWFDEENQIIFQISAFLEKDEMIKLAERVEKK